MSETRLRVRRFEVTNSQRFTDLGLLKPGQPILLMVQLKAIGCIQYIYIHLLYTVYLMFLRELTIQ